MDRHNLPGVTARDVAEAHREDLKVQDRYGCRALTYWFDETKGIAFCLVEAPDINSVTAMHNQAHGLIPHKIVEVDNRLVEAFLGRIKDPDRPPGISDSELFIFSDPAFRIIMSINFRNVLRFKMKRVKTTGQILLKKQTDTIKGIFEKFNGRQTRRTGDGLMVSFSSINKAVRCAIEIQEEINSHKTGSANGILSPSIGMSGGEPVTAKADFFGEAVQLAWRLSYIAREGKIIGSSKIYNYLKGAHIFEKEDTERFIILDPEEEFFLNQLMDATESSWNRENFNVNLLSRHIGLSKSQLYRKIIALTGYSPNNFVREYRLEQAIKMIENKQGNIAQVAFESGFSNPGYFSKCFRNQFGMLPSEYARSLI